MSISSFKYLARLKAEKILRKNKFNRTQDEWYYFLHIPKTAGTTFRHIIYDTFLQDQIYPNLYELRHMDGGEFLIWPEFSEHHETIFPNHKKWLIGHWGWDAVGLFPENPPKTLCFFRDPYSRTLSGLHHRLRKTPDGLENPEPIIDDFLKHEGRMMFRFFGDVPPKLDLILSRIDQLDFIGLTEQFDRSIALCEKIFGWSLKVADKKNVAKYDPSSILNDHHKTLMDAAIKEDRIIYDHAVRRFETLCAKYGV